MFSMRPVRGFEFETPDTEFHPQIFPFFGRGGFFSASSFFSKREITETHPSKTICCLCRLVATYGFSMRFLGKIGQSKVFF